MLYKRLLAAATAVLLAAGLAGCSGDSGRPSKEDAAAGLTKALEPTFGEDDFTKELADCIVDKTYDDLSDNDVKTLASGNETQVSLLMQKNENLSGIIGTCWGFDDIDDGDEEDLSVGIGSVTIDGVEFTDSDSGSEYILVTFTWTNKTKKTRDFLFYADVAVTQNGEKLESYYGWREDLEGMGSSTDEIDPGETIQFRAAYTPIDKSDVSVLVTVGYDDPPVVLVEGAFPIE